MALTVKRNTQRYFERGYVVCKDKFLSGWGGAARGSSFVALGVEQPEDVDVIFRNAKDRGDMKGCELRSSYLFLERKRGNNHVTIADRETFGQWYNPNRPFRKGK